MKKMNKPNYCIDCTHHSKSAGGVFDYCSAANDEKFDPVKKELSDQRDCRSVRGDISINHTVDYCNLWEPNPKGKAILLIKHLWSRFPKISFASSESDR